MRKSKLRVEFNFSARRVRAQLPIPELLQFNLPFLPFLFLYSSLLSITTEAIYHSEVLVHVLDLH